jgi:heat shock protein HslJ
MRGRSWAHTALLLVTVGLAGCGSETVTQAPGASPPGATPTGDWLSTTVTTGGAPRNLVAGTRIWLGFTDGMLRADAGCNSMSGPVRFDRGVLIVESLAQTDMGCPDGRNEQDQFVSGWLTARPAYRYDGDHLTLSTRDTEVVFGPKQAVQPDLPLEGTRWQVTHLTRGPWPTASPDPNSSVSASPAPPDAYLQFADGKLAGSDGCNALFGDAAVAGDRIRFGPIGTTKKACPGVTGTDAVRAVLTGTVGWRIEDNVLTLTNAIGSGLQLRAPPDSAVATPPCCKPLVTGSPGPAKDLPLNTAEPATGSPGPGPAQRLSTSSR